MNLAEQLAPRKEAIVKKWFDRVINTYPAETSRFLGSQKDPFANPVGHGTLESLQQLLGLLYTDLDRPAALKALDTLVRIRAVQAFSPSQAVGFIFDLKELIFDKATDTQLSAEQRIVIERRIDQLALVAFDLFVQCREKIYELKGNEMRDRTYKAFARAGLVKDSS